MLVRNLNRLKILTLALVLPLFSISVNAMNYEPRNLEEKYNSKYNIDFTYEEFCNTNVELQETVRKLICDECSKPENNVNTTLLKNLLAFNDIKTPILSLNDDYIKKFNIKNYNIQKMASSIVHLKGMMKNIIYDQIPKMLDTLLLENNKYDDNLRAIVIQTHEHFQNILNGINTNELTKDSYDLLNSGCSILLKVDDALQNNNINPVQNGLINGIENYEENNVQNNINDNNDNDDNDENEHYNMENNIKNISVNILDNSNINNFNDNIINDSLDNINNELDREGNNNNFYLFNDNAHDNNINNEDNDAEIDNQGEFIILNNSYNNFNNGDDENVYINHDEHQLENYPINNNRANDIEEISPIEKALGMPKSCKTMYNNLIDAIAKNKTYDINNIIMPELRRYIFNDDYVNLELLLSNADDNTLDAITSILNLELVKENILFSREKIKTTLNRLNVQLSSTNLLGVFNINDKENFQQLLKENVNENCERYFADIRKLTNVIDSLQEMKLSAKVNNIVEKLQEIINKNTSFLKELKTHHVNNWEPVFNKAYNAKNSNLDTLLNVNFSSLQKQITHIEYDEICRGFWTFYNKVLGDGFKNLPIILSSNDTENLEQIQAILNNNIVYDSLIEVHTKKINKDIQDITKKFVSDKLKDNINNVDVDNDKMTYQAEIWRYISKEANQNQDFIKSIHQREVQNHVARQILGSMTDLTNDICKYIEKTFKKLIKDPSKFCKAYYNNNENNM